MISGVCHKVDENCAFQAIMQWVVVIPYWCFGQPSGPIFKGQPRRAQFLHVYLSRTGEQLRLSGELLNLFININSITFYLFTDIKQQT